MAWAPRRLGIRKGSRVGLSPRAQGSDAHPGSFGTAMDTVWGKRHSSAIREQGPQGPVVPTLGDSHGTRDKQDTHYDFGILKRQQFSNLLLRSWTPGAGVG